MDFFRNSRSILLFSTLDICKNGLSWYNGTKPFSNFVLGYFFMSSFCPVHKLYVFHTSKVFHVASHYNHVVRHSGGGNEQIKVFNSYPSLCQSYFFQAKAMNGIVKAHSFVTINKGLYLMQPFISSVERGSLLHAPQRDSSSCATRCFLSVSVSCKEEWIRLARILRSAAESRWAVNHTESNVIGIVIEFFVV